MPLVRPKLFLLREKLKKSKYLVRILTSLVINKAILAFWAGYIGIKLKLKDVIYTIKALTFSFNIALINSFLLIISIYLIVDKALVVV